MQFPDGNSVNYSYTTDYSLSAATFPDGTNIQYLYNEPGNLSGTFAAGFYLTGVIDENGARAANITYVDGLARSSSGANNAGRVEVSTSSYQSAYVSFSDVNFNFKFSTIAGNSRLTSVSGASVCGACWLPAAISYDANGGEISRTDSKGIVTRYTRDFRGLALSKTQAYGTADAVTTNTSWHPSFPLPLTVTVGAKQQSYTYDAVGKMLSNSLTDLSTGVSRTTNYEYDASGNVVRIDGPRTDVSDVTTFEYDGQSNLVAVRDALGHQTRFQTYDANGNPHQILDANGVITQLTYDLRGRITARSVEGQTTSYLYRPSGPLKEVRLPDGAALNYEYDDADRLVGLRDAKGNRIQYTLDIQGRRTAEEIFDSSGLLQKRATKAYKIYNSTIDGANGQEVKFNRDQLGNETQRTEAGSFITNRSYDYRNRVIALTDAANGVSQFTYDILDNLTSVTDPRGNVTRYTYDALGQLTKQESPDSGTTVFEYDRAGNMVGQTDARGVTKTYSLDSINRITATSFASDSAQNILYLYDGANYSASVPNALGKLTGTKTAKENAVFYYDNQGRLTKKESTAFGQTLTTSFGYDNAGRLISLGYPSGTTVFYDRDMHGEIVRVRLVRNGVASVIATNISYKPFGPVSGLTLGNGLVVSRAFDLDYRPSRLFDGSVLDRSYQYSARDEITSIIDAAKLGLANTFKYDALSRVNSSMTVSSGIQEWTYDSAGNRLHKTQIGLSSPLEDYQYAADSNRLIETTGTIPTFLTPSGESSAPPASTIGAYIFLIHDSDNVRFDYDASGNVTAKGDWRYSYDLNHRLASASHRPSNFLQTLIPVLAQLPDIPAITSQSYTPQGQRFDKETSTRHTRFSYDEQGFLIAETLTDGTVISEYIWLDGKPLALVSSLATAASLPSTGLRDIFYYHVDHLGTPQQLTDANQQVVWEGFQDPHGAVTPIKQLVVNNLRLPGQYYDSETGLHQNWHRDYDPSLGRYLQSDPIGLLGGINTYAYVGGNPVSRIDPSGLTPDFDVAFAVSTNATYRQPDFYFFSASGMSITYGIYISRSGSVYVNPPFLGAALPFKPGAMAGVGYIQGSCPEDSRDSRADNFLGGLGYAGTIGLGGVAGGAMVSPGNGTAAVFGAGSPGATGSFGINLGGY